MSSPKSRAGRPSPEQAERKRANLILAALDEFARVGFSAASMRDIAKAAEISSRTLYNYYPDKLALFAACLEHSGHAIQPTLPKLSGDLHSQLVNYTVAMQEQLSTPQAMQITTLIFREANGFDALRDIAREQFERYQVAPVARILEDHNMSGDQAKLLAPQFVSMAFGEWQRRVLFGGPPLTKEIATTQAQIAADIFISGISHFYKL
ncbi:putative TetR family transcriptional regulator [Caenibius tardaugens NBRC 16725]|uniref:Putative TetR family transcriptional regulator n=1 Tax=Caenibius tardaugens NBRC 16725 TaxID=1219035 RepID=U2YBW5_9SPHN|nr:TetR/AcrR family transcriptional regulator [Caenibius tardaugens]AZI35350.1 TetR/AcrR family transcriptional regulator [Caenibius tardaugens NBRC 16725]GAD51031.1 putative TetR family transcriptional regulator [Caenibius tardaugens NBRC 16725]